MLCFWLLFWSILIPIVSYDALSDKLPVIAPVVIAIELVFPSHCVDLHAIAVSEAQLNNSALVVAILKVIDI